MVTRRAICFFGFWMVLAAPACLNDSWLFQQEQDMILAYNSSVSSLDTAPAGDSRRFDGMLMLLAGVTLVAGSIVLGIRCRRSFGWTAIIVGTICLAAGVLLILLLQSERGRPRLPVLVEAPRHELPLPHSYPKKPGGLALRLAMVHDVIHEHYPRHSPQWYEARNTSSRQAIEAIVAAQGAGSTDAARLAAMDDLSVGLDHLGKADDAIAVQRRKLELLSADSSIDRYTTYANLGTHLIHRYIPKLLAGDRRAERGLQEGLSFIDQAIEVNPDAHFGRERWQAIAVRYLLSAQRDPSLMDRYDMVGLTTEVESFSNQGHAYSGWPREAFRKIRRLQTLPQGSEEFASRRTEAIAKLEVRLESGEDGWVPFDEPLLAVIGMWRYGGGANPYFSLVIAHTMERIGQRYLAWYAFERTRLMADRYAADPEIRDRLLAHCGAEQNRLASALNKTHDELQANFEAELKKGQDWQQAYQAYEVEQLAQGVDIRAADFYTAFYQKHGRIETASEGPDRVIMPDFPYYRSPAYEAGMYLPSLSLVLGMVSLIMLALSWRQS